MHKCRTRDKVVTIKVENQRKVLAKVWFHLPRKITAQLKLNKNCIKKGEIHKSQWVIPMRIRTKDQLYSLRCRTCKHLNSSLTILSSRWTRLPSSTWITTSINLWHLKILSCKTGLYRMKALSLHCLHQVWKEALTMLWRRRKQRELIEKMRRSWKVCLVKHLRFLKSSSMTTKEGMTSWKSYSKKRKICQPSIF